jgi:hypothetical protein
MAMSRPRYSPGYAAFADASDVGGCSTRSLRTTAPRVGRADLQRPALAHPAAPARPLVSVVHEERIENIRAPQSTRVVGQQDGARECPRLLRVTIGGLLDSIVGERPRASRLVPPPRLDLPADNVGDPIYSAVGREVRARPGDVRQSVSFTGARLPLIRGIFIFRIGQNIRDVNDLLVAHCSPVFLNDSNAIDALIVR